MLVRMGVSNFRSIREYTELSLVALEAIKDASPGIITWSSSKIRLLPVVLLYGANAAGKSSVFNAMGMMRNHVLYSFSKREATAPINRVSFALDTNSATSSSQFDCDFVLNNIRYHYGFEFNNDQYLREWLYYFPEGYRRILFNRDYENGEIEFGKYLKGRNRIIEELTRKNSLFLSAAAQNSHEQLTPVYEFFRTKILGAGTAVNNDTIQKQISAANDPRLVPFLRYADTGIEKISISDRDVSEEQRKIYLRIKSALEEMPEVSDQISDEMESGKLVRFSHTGEGATFDLPFSTESRGTRRVSALALAAFKALDGGATLFIDELDASLHTLLAMKLVELFQDPAFNKHGAQLVATTHDTNILCSKQLRRDQIWFVEKNSRGATSIYPLTDIKTRNTDNLEKGYLQGRFGAVPYLGRIDDLFQGHVDAEA